MVVALVAALFPGPLKRPIPCRPIELASALLAVVLVWLLLAVHVALSPGAEA